MKRKYKIILAVAGLFLVIHLSITGAGYGYLYKAIFYNYANIDDNRIFPSRRIEAGTPLPWNISAEYNRKPLPSYVRNELETLESVAFMIVKNDSIVYEEYWDGYSDSSLSNSFSMAKTFVAILTGCAIADGKIRDLDQPVHEFLPEFLEGKKKEVTIRHLITMSSGSDWDESYANPLSVTTRAYYGDDLEDVIGRINIIESPGVTFRYQSGNSLLLAAVLNKAVGKPLSEYFSEKIWKPVGADHDAEWSLDRKNGTEKSYCCVYSNVRDFARIGKLFLKKGRVNGKQVVPEAFAEESVRPAPLKDKDGKPADCYGYTWWLIPDYKGKDIFYARGILGQYVIVIPEENIIIARLGKKRGEKLGYHQQEVYKYIDGALEMYGNKQ